EIQYLNVLKVKHVDGIIFLSAALSNHNAIKRLNSEGFPIVVLDRTLDDENIMTVYLDNFAGGYMATKHLAEFGHKRIGCITGPLKNKLAKHRFCGYKKALEEMRISFDEHLVHEGNFKTNGGEFGAKKLLKAGATAIFACNDLMAYGAYKVIQEQGLKIPQDISVVGFDDIFMSDILAPPLTSVKQPTHVMGMVSAAMLIKSIKGEKLEKTKMEFKPTLSVRKSVSPPAKS
ncbi:MAG: LacI family transcriptional regulator, partial [Thermoanaerobacteraceae bacterium]|nr:LacI family transcriptional regulator [Thermoanaerobacteraceae bacterium]